METSSSRASLIEAALSYAARGWRVIPLYGLHDGQCTCPKRGQCATPGKHPPYRNWPEHASVDTRQIHTWWRQRPLANIGIVTGIASGLVVVDVDPRHGGDVNWDELQRSYHTIPHSPQSLTGGGGFHEYFACTEMLPSVDLAHGIQFQTEHHLVVAPPSLHASGRTYSWEASHDPDDTPLAPLPDWIRALAMAHTREATTVLSWGPEMLTHVNIDSLPLSPRIKAVIREGSDPHQVQRYPSRSEAVFAVIMACLVADIDDTTIASLLLDPAYKISEKPRSQRDSRSPQYQANITAWVAHEIARGRAKREIRPSSTTAASNGRSPLGFPPVASDALLARPWREALLLNKQGYPSHNASNLGLFLAHHPHWQGRFWWDAVRSLPMLDMDPITKETITKIAQWFGLEERLAITNTRLLDECLCLECHEHPRDVLQTWLNSLAPWDEMPRLNHWLADVAGIDHTSYAMGVSRIIPLSMVARALQPGCLYRYVVIFEGPEEVGKSSLVKAIASPSWYLELSMALESKEAHMVIQGAWVAEMAELDSLSRTENTRLKAFITLTEDTWIPKYSNYRVSNPRRTIFIGTTNDSNYLTGQTGNTRFLPITVGTIDVEMFLAQREQLFAEAVHVYRQGPDTWWQLPDEALSGAVIEREKRRVPNIYEDDLRLWLDSTRFGVSYGIGTDIYIPRCNEVTWYEIARWFLQLDTPERWKDIPLQKQIAATMKQLGWVNRVIWREGRTFRIWEKTAALTSETRD